MPVLEVAFLRSYCMFEQDIPDVRVAAPAQSSFDGWAKTAAERERHKANNTILLVDTGQALGGFIE
jgi:hypothetical protein